MLSTWVISWNNPGSDDKLWIQLALSRLGNCVCLFVCLWIVAMATSLVQTSTYSVLQFTHVVYGLLLHVATFAYCQRWCVVIKCWHRVLLV